MADEVASIDREGMCEEMRKADDVIVVTITNGRMSVLASSPDADKALSMLAVAEHVMTRTLADAMFADEPTPPPH